MVGFGVRWIARGYWGGDGWGKMLAVGNVGHGETGGSGWIRLDLHHIPERQQVWIPGDIVMKLPNDHCRLSRHFFFMGPVVSSGCVWDEGMPPKWEHDDPPSFFPPIPSIKTAPGWCSQTPQTCEDPGIVAQGRGATAGVGLSPRHRQVAAGRGPSRRTETRGGGWCATGGAAWAAGPVVGF